MKKYFWLFTAVLAVIALVFTGCSGGGNNNKGNDDDDDDDIVITGDDNCPDCGAYSCTETGVFKVKFGSRLVKITGATGTGGNLTIADYDGSLAVLAPWSEVANDETNMGPGVSFPDCAAPAASAVLNLAVPVTITNYNNVKLTWHHSFYDTPSMRFNSIGSLYVNLHSATTGKVLYLTDSYHGPGDNAGQADFNTLNITPKTYNFATHNEGYAGAPPAIKAGDPYLATPNHGSKAELGAKIDKISVDLFFVTYARWVPNNWDGFGGWGHWFTLPYEGLNENKDLGPLYPEPVQVSFGLNTVLRIREIEFLQ